MSTPPLQSEIIMAREALRERLPGDWMAVEASYVCESCRIVTTDSRRCPVCASEHSLHGLWAIVDRPQPPAAKKRPRKLPWASCGERGRT